jgi:hypothetical protein
MALLSCIAVKKRRRQTEAGHGRARHVGHGRRKSFGGIKMKSRSKLYAQKAIVLDENGDNGLAREMSFAYYLTESDIANEAELFDGVAERSSGDSGQGMPAHGVYVREARADEARADEVRADEARAGEPQTCDGQAGEVQAQEARAGKTRASKPQTGEAQAQEAQAGAYLAREGAERAFAPSRPARYGGHAARNGVCYGVRVTLSENGKTEDACVDGITPDKSSALRLAELLAENLATPLSLRDILDDLLGAH